MAFLDKVRQKLLDVGVANTTTWPCYIGFMPDDQDQCLGLFDSGGLPADTLNRENRHPSFMVLVRAARMDYAVCMAKWQAVYSALQDAAQTGGSPDTLSGVVFIQAMQSHPNAFIDEKQRQNMTANFHAKTVGP